MSQMTVKETAEVYQT